MSIINFYYLCHIVTSNKYLHYATMMRVIMVVKISLLKYTESRNIGDDIQSIATSHLLPFFHDYIDRDRLASFRDEEGRHVVVMNGYFLENLSEWPPSSDIYPIFSGFHIARKAREVMARHRKYFRKYEPVGCRDQGTANFLESLGIRTEITHCATLTLPRRERSPKNGKLVIVDCDDIRFPKSVKKNHVLLTHRISPAYSFQTRMQMAQELLDFYRDEAGVVVTSRIHCAMPCAAMGVPVIFFGDSNDYRQHIIKEIGLTIHSLRLARKSNPLSRLYRHQVNWSGETVDLEARKAAIRDFIARKLEGLISNS